MAAQLNVPPDPRVTESLEQLYERFRAELRRFFARHSSVQEADDLLQEMFLQLLHRRPPDELRDAQRYLFVVAWNVLHTVKRRERPLMLIGDIGGEADRERDRLLWSEDDSSSLLAQEQMTQVLLRLPRACQVAMVRQYRDNHSYEQIAQELNVTVHAVKKYIMKALNEFRMHYSGELDRK